MNKTEKSSKMMGNFLVDFLAIFYQKVKNYFGLSIRYPLATIDVIRLNMPAIKSYIENLFWTLFYKPDHYMLPALPELVETSS
jgi:hypothetical protein